ncbi:MAG: hypothetical protein ACYTBZ_17620 [Planctomycetota bacterium]
MIEQKQMQVNGLTVPVYSLNTVVIGSGAAGLNCVCRLFREMEETGIENPQDQIALLTRGVGLGTSNKRWAPVGSPTGPTTLPTP